MFKILILFLSHDRDSTIAFAGHSNSAMSLLKTYEIGILPPKERIYRWPGSMHSSIKLPE